MPEIISTVPTQRTRPLVASMKHICLTLLVLAGIAVQANGQGGRGGFTVTSGSGTAFTSEEDYERLSQTQSAVSLPRQLGARGVGDTAAGDDCEKIDEAIQVAAQGAVANSRAIHLDGGNWRCKDAHYLMLLPRDMGDYLNTFLRKGRAQFSLTLIQGRIVSCDISGGAGYNPFSYIIGQVIDYTHMGSGGAVYARADASGTPLPGSCVVEQAGMHYPSMQDVNVLSFAQGADGAIATITLTAGRVSSAQIVPNGSSMPKGEWLHDCSLYWLPTWVRLHD